MAGSCLHTNLSPRLAWKWKTGLWRPGAVRQAHGRCEADGGQQRGKDKDDGTPLASAGAGGHPFHMCVMTRSKTAHAEVPSPWSPRRAPLRRGRDGRFTTRGSHIALQSAPLHSNSADEVGSLAGIHAS